MAKQAIVGCALFLASTTPGCAFSVQSLLSIRNCHGSYPAMRRGTVVFMSYMDDRNRRPPGGMGGGGMGGPPPGQRGGGMGGPGMGRGPSSPDMGRGPPPPIDGRDNMSADRRDEGAPRNAHLDRHASDYLDELRAKRSGNRGGSTIPADPNQGRSFSANNPPGAFSVPNAGNTSGQPRRGPDGRAGLGALASGVSTPNDKYNFDGPPRRERGGYRGGPAGGPNQPMRGGPAGGPNQPFNERGGYGNNFGPMRGDVPMRGEPMRGDVPMMGEPMRGGDPMRGPPRAPGPRDPRDMVMPGPDPRDMDILQLQDEIERLRTENAMLKRSAKDLMNNFNELSNRLFDVDETLKKVAKVFPSEEELESLEWLLKK